VHFSRRVEAGFTAGQVSSDGGALLLREVEGKINLLGQLGACFRDGRDPDRVEHPLPEMLSQRIYGLARQNRNKEQMCLFADRLSTNEIEGNQLRLYFSALAYTLIEALRRLALKGTEWAQAQVDTLRRKLFKIGAIVRISVRRIRLQMSSAYPWKDLYTRAFNALRC
jgi:hypothetical protein